MSTLYKAYFFIRYTPKHNLYRKIKALTLELFLKTAININKL